MGTAVKTWHQLVCLSPLKLCDSVLLLVSVRRCVIDKEDKYYVCMTHVLSVCGTCVCEGASERRRAKERWKFE